MVVVAASESKTRESLNSYTSLCYLFTVVRLGLVANFEANFTLHFSSSSQNNRQVFSWSREAATFINWQTVACIIHWLPDRQLTAKLFCFACIHGHFSSARSLHLLNHTFATHTLRMALFLKEQRYQEFPRQRQFETVLRRGKCFPLFFALNKHIFWSGGPPHLYNYTVGETLNTALNTLT